MRMLLLLAASLAASALVAQVDPPKKLTPEERKQLEAKRLEANAAGVKAFQAGQYAEAQKSLEAALDVARRLYPKSEYPEGHADLALSLNDMAATLKVIGKPASAEPLFREALEMRKRLYPKQDHPHVVLSLGNLAAILRELGKPAEAEPFFREALEMQRRRFKGDHFELAVTLNQFGLLLQGLGKFTEAEQLLRETLEMLKRLSPQPDHPAVATSLNNLGILCSVQGRHREAETYFRDALEMRQRLAKGDDVLVVASLQELAAMYERMDKPVEVERLNREILAMQRRLFKGDHADIARTLSRLIVPLVALGRHTETEPLLKEALEMQRRLFKGDHPDLAQTLGNMAYLHALLGHGPEALASAKESLAMRKRLFPGDSSEVAHSFSALGFVLKKGRYITEANDAFGEALAIHKRLSKGDDPYVAAALNNRGLMLRDLGKLEEAESHFRDATGIFQRLYQGDHEGTARSLNNLAGVLMGLGKPVAAEQLQREALQISTRLVTDAVARVSEGEALTLCALTPRFRDLYFSYSQSARQNPATTYAQVWATKGMVARAFESRLLLARTADTPEAAAILTNVASLRQRRADLILAPQPPDATGKAQREAELKKLAIGINELDQRLQQSLPSAERLKLLSVANPTELQRLLPADAVFVDFFGYTLYEYDLKNPGLAGEKQTPSFLAFVVTKDAVKWIDLGSGLPIDKAVNTWRESITTPPFAIPEDVPAKVRELVWAKVRKEFPTNTKVVYISPDLTLTRVPWSALPGDEPGKIVLEEFAVAVVPHALFLLDQLRPRDPSTKSGGLLAVGGVSYDNIANPPSLWAAARAVGQTRGNIPVKPGAKLEWANLKFTKPEAEMSVRIAARKKIDTRLLTGAETTTERVLTALPKAKYAHLATHGFFADASFQSVLQVDPKLFEITQHGERVGAGALSPMTMSGLVFSGANKPETCGRGLVTGDHLIDRDLSGLELAVLSACETGLGDVAGGEGVFGLQRAFHLAGCRNVVASLWKVDDAATAALMNEFYTQLWTHDQPPVIALQKAQLAIYRADPKDFPKLASRGIEEGTIDLSNVPVKKYPANAAMKGNHPALWAAFTLSGTGR